MKIDVHAHIGRLVNGEDMSLEKQLRGMDAYGVDYALISHIECGERLLEDNPLADRQQMKNLAAIEAAAEHPRRLGVLLWCCPDDPGYSADFERLYRDNRKLIKGLKVHPDMSRTDANDKRLWPYYEMAARWRLPVLVHTRENRHSKVSYVVEMARRFPNVPFILGHMSLSDDKEESLQALETYENMYGDTAWVYSTVLAEAEKRGVIHKILFGTDSPIKGWDTYGDPEFYQAYDHLDEILTQESCLRVFFQNAVQLFRMED